MNKNTRSDISTSRTERSKKKKEQDHTKVKKGIIVTFLIIIVCSCSFIWRKQIYILILDAFYSNDIKSALDRSFVPIGNENERTTDKKNLNEPFSLLLMGTDQRENEPSRSDSLIYSVIRPLDSRILLISIPRDSYTDIVGYNKKSKINAAFVHGGAKMTIATVENLLGQPIQYYASINFKGLVDVVNTLGGIELPITKDIVNKGKNHDKFIIKANKPVYSGEEALNYVRYREDSDFNRTERHRIFISAMLNRFKNLGNLSKIDDVIKIGGENLNTNMKSDLVLQLAKAAINNTPTISNYMLKGSDLKIDGIYYYSLDEKDLKYVRDLIGKWLSPNTNYLELNVDLKNK